MSLKHSLLVMLADRPASGYDLSQQFKGSVGFFWNASHQQIYQQLKALTEAGWVQFSTEQQTGKPDKKLYAVTPLGMDALIEWLEQPAQPNSYKDALLIKLYAGKHLPRATLILELERHQGIHKKSLAKLLAIETEYFALSTNEQKAMRLPYLTLKRGISGEQNWLAWATDTLTELKGDTA